MKTARARFATFCLIACFTAGSTVVADDKTDSKGKETDKKEAVDPKLSADIRKLLKVSGQGELGIQAMGQMIGSFKQAMPHVPAEFWDEFMKEVDADDLVDLVVPIYAKHFTREDIQGLIKFYQSPLGKKFTSKQGVIMQESMAAGQIWGEGISKKLLKRLADRGYRT